MSMMDTAQKARKASIALAAMDTESKNKALNGYYENLRESILRRN